MDGIIAFLYIRTLLLLIFTIWFLCRIKEKMDMLGKNRTGYERICKKEMKKNKYHIKRNCCRFLILSFVDVVIPAVQDFPNAMSENYLEVEGTVTKWNYSDEEKSEIRVIGIMDNKTKKEIFVTVYSKGIHKGEYLKVKYLPHSKYGAIEEDK